MRTIPKDFPVLIGLSLQQCVKIIIDNKLVFRIAQQDDVKYRMGNSHIPYRFNLFIKNGIIEDYKIF